MLTEYESSGFSVEDYCQYKNLNTDTIQSWLHKHKHKEQTTPAFVTLNIKEDDDQAEVLFAEYKGLKFYKPMDVSFFKALIS